MGINSRNKIMTVTNVPQYALSKKEERFHQPARVAIVRKIVISKNVSKIQTFSPGRLDDRYRISTKMNSREKNKK